ncbi:MAG TPA: acyltransferase domain-containing protein [Albitalea sp.]|nr:acyltransferase domain-containing protein [Albitalea sp.]
MSFAIIFSGQGMQHAAMLPWLADDELVERTRAELGVIDWRTHLNDAGWASRNANAQVLLTGLALAAWTQLSRALPPPAAVAGYSVGELASFAAAGVFDAGMAITLAGTRARAMDRCAAATPGGLLAVSGLPPARIERLCDASGAAVAIDNGSHAVVLGGPLAALDAAERAAQAAGAHCTRLKVDVASHTPWMQAAADEFARALSTLPLRSPRVPLFSNAADRVTTAAQAARALALQIATTVQWSACMDQIRARQVGCVLEIGPGAALARMWNERFPDVPARSVDEFRSASAIVDWVLRNGSG